ncbi:MAG: DUF3857 domain-containing protein [Flavicella sp.]|nr:DUF3857 domain-containing protein [Flavicella sp.]
MKNLTLLCVTLLVTTTFTFAQKRKFGKIKKEELQETSYAKDSLANACYLYKKRETNFVFNEQKFTFELVTKVHEIIKIYNNDGFDHATVTINYYDPETGSSDEEVHNIKAYTYNLENDKVKKEKLSSKNVFKDQANKFWANKKFTMPNVNEGSIIEYSYTIISPYWDIRDLDFQYDIPIKELFYSTEIPEYYNFSKQNKGYYFITPQEETLNRSISWTNKTRTTGNISSTSYDNEKVNHTSKHTVYYQKDIPALRDNEPYMSSINNYRGGVKYELSSTRFPNSNLKQYSSTWESVSKTIFENSSFGQELKYSNYFKDDLETILQGKTTYQQKLITILEFAKSKVKWNGYSGKYTNKGVRKAYKEGTGNVAEINLMLVSMLREAGFTANPVLLSTRDNGIPFFPTLEGFNYVIAAVHAEGAGYILMDATEQYSSPNNLPLRDLNWDGRMIADDGRSKAISLAPQKYSEENNSLSISIDGDYHVNGLLRRKMDGLKAFSYRSKNNKTKEEELIQKLENRFHVEINNFRVGNKNIPYKAFTQMIQFESDDMIEVINGKMYINPLFFFSTTVNPFKTEERIFPVDYGTPWKEKNQISIKIPEGYKIESIPETFGIGLPENLGLYKFLIKANNNSISIKTEEIINSSIISPKYYGDLKNFYAELVSKQKKKIVLTKI